jgi:putative glycosyltransferase (TIGR04348 family)
MPRSRTPALLLATPYLADANNGNWRTAARWARLLSPSYRIIVQATSAPVTEGKAADALALIALHARRSHPAIAAWRDAYPQRALIVAMTGTDLYRDLPSGDASTRTSVAMADRLLVLQSDAVHALPEAMRAKARVVFQSARTLVPWPHKSSHRLHCVLVAHLREEKDPATAFAAWRLLPRDVPATLTIIGAALDPALGRTARDLAAADPRVQWLGPREHAWTRQAIKRAHLLVIPSRMEGGANVVVEAITSGTAVLGTRMSGNVGMLGNDYPGYFTVGAPSELADLVARAASDRAFLRKLEGHCRRRAHLFTPTAERRGLIAVVNEARSLHGNTMVA